MLSDFSKEDQAKIKALLSSRSYTGAASLARSKDCGQLDERWNRWMKELLKRGFDETELWSLKISTLRWFLPRLKAFRKADKLSIPMDWDGDEDGMTKWNKTLDEMIWLCEELLYEKEFEKITLKKPFDHEEYKKYTIKIERCKKIFGQFFMDLWD